MIVYANITVEIKWDITEFIVIHEMINKDLFNGKEKFIYQSVDLQMYMVWMYCIFQKKEQFGYAITKWQ